MGMVAILFLRNCNDYIHTSFFPSNILPCVHNGSFPVQLELLGTVKLLWKTNRGEVSCQKEIQQPPRTSFFAFISAAQIPSVSDILVKDPLLLPLSYLEPIVQVHNGCLCAFSLLSILNSRSPSLSLQYVQCKWQRTEWWWMFETGGGPAAINLPEASPDCEDVRARAEAADTWRASQSLSSRVGSHPLYQRALSASSRICQQHNTSHSLSPTPSRHCSRSWSRDSTLPQSLCKEGLLLNTREVHGHLVQFSPKGSIQKKQ